MVNLWINRQFSIDHRIQMQLQFAINYRIRWFDFVLGKSIGDIGQSLSQEQDLFAKRLSSTELDPNHVQQ